MDWICSHDMEPSCFGIRYLDTREFTTKSITSSQMVQTNVSWIPGKPESLNPIHSLKQKMGINSVRNDSHLTPMWPWPLEASKLLLLWLGYSLRVSPHLSPRFLFQSPLSGFSVREPPPVGRSVCNLFLRNLLCPDLAGVLSPLRDPAFTTKQTGVPFISHLACQIYNTDLGKVKFFFNLI